MAHTISDQPTFLNDVLAKLAQLGNPLDAEEGQALTDYVMTLYNSGKSVVDAESDLSEVLPNPGDFTTWVYNYIDNDKKQAALAKTQSKKRTIDETEHKNSSETMTEERTAKQFKVNKIVWDLAPSAQAQSKAPISASRQESEKSPPNENIIEKRRARFGEVEKDSLPPSKHVDHGGLTIAGRANHLNSSKSGAVGITSRLGSGGIHSRLGGKFGEVVPQTQRETSSEAKTTDTLSAAENLNSGISGRPEIRVFSNDNPHQQFQHGNPRQQHWNNNVPNHYVDSNDLKNNQNNFGNRYSNGAGYRQNNNFQQHQSNNRSFFPQGNGIQPMQSNGQPQIVQQFGLDQFGNIIPLGPNGIPLMGMNTGFRAGMQSKNFNNSRGGGRSFRGGHSASKPWPSSNQPPSEIAATGTEISELAGSAKVHAASSVIGSDEGAEIIMEGTQSSLPINQGGSAGVSENETQGAATNISQQQNLVQQQIQCRFGAMCTRYDCKFMHPWNSKQCKFWPNCINPTCQFFHPTAGGDQPERTDLSTIPCKFDAYCNKPGCPYKHTRAGGNKSLVLNKSSTMAHVSERAFAVDEPTEQVLGEAEENEAELNETEPKNDELVGEEELLS